MPKPKLQTVSMTFPVLRGKAWTDEFLDRPLPPYAYDTETGVAKSAWEVEVPVEVTATWVPASTSPGLYYEYVEPAFIEDFEATVDGKPFYLTDDEVELAKMALFERAGDL